MEDEQLKNLPEEMGTSQDELEALLRQSRGATSRTPDVRLPTSSKRPNFLLWGIVFLAIVLLVGTGYFVVRGLVFSKGSVIFELNEDQVALEISGRDYGQINSGTSIKLSAGAHTVKLSKPGFLEIEEEFELKRGEATALYFDLLPIPVIESIVEQPVEYARLSTDGSEISYFDPKAKLFKSVGLFEDEISQIPSRKVVTLFRDSYPNIQGVAWSPANQSAIVKLTNRSSLSNMLDNRNVRGAYVPLGERPSQGPANFNGTNTWLFAVNQESSRGWQPILLNDSVRAAAFSEDGSLIVYIYEPADGEYSIVQAWPDGTEWERKITDAPRLSSPVLTWGTDDRYLFIEDGDKLFMADLISGEVADIFGDRVPGSWFDISTSGDRVAYLAQTGSSGVQLKIYDFFSEESKVVEDVVTGETSIFVWVGTDSILLASQNQELININLKKSSRSHIPFIGTSPEIRVRAMDYSPSANTLMLVTDRDIAIMKI